MTMRTPQGAADDDDSEGTGLDAELIKSYLSFGARAIRKRVRAVVLIFLVTMLVVVAVVSVWPRTYYCETRLTAQSAGALGGDQREDLSKSFDGAVATVLRYENLKGIVQQTDLVKHWSEGRAPLQRWKDGIWKRLVGEPSEKDVVEALVATLQSALYVEAQNGILTIGASWHEPQMAARLVDTARQNFLESRHVSEISMLAENISILEGHLGRVRNEIYDIADNVKKLREEKRVKAEQAVAKASEKGDGGVEDTAATRPVRAAAPSASPAADEELIQLKVQLETKQQALKEIEGERVRNLRELQARLRDLKLTYTDVHPQVVHARASIESLSKDSPQIIALRSEVLDLEERVRQRNSHGETVRVRAGYGSGRGGSAAPSASTQLPPELMSLVRDSAGDIDPTVTAQFELAVRRFSGLQDEISSARIELDRAQAAFKHRYKLMSPAEVPNAPIKPKSKLILLGGLAGALALALLVALLAELRTGKIVERWQVAQLDLPILAELRLPRGPTH